MKARDEADVDPVPCANCGGNISAAYCGHCGQRRFRPQDRRLAHLAREFFEALTSFDGRLWRSMRALLFRPGLLSREYIDGRRARWMSPVALFLLANVLYFFAPGMNDFDLPLRDHVSGALVLEFDPAVAALPAARRDAIAAYGGQVHSRFTEPWVRERLHDIAREQPGKPALDTLAQRYAVASANISKALIVLHVPFMALALLVVMAGTHRYFAEHVVVALHYFAFVLFLFELVVLPLGWLLERVTLGSVAEHVVVYALPLLLSLYAIVAIRRAYACGWPRAVFGGLALVAALLATNLVAYRTLQFAIVLALA